MKRPAPIPASKQAAADAYHVALRAYEDSVEAALALRVADAAEAEAYRQLRETRLREATAALVSS